MPLNLGQLNSEVIMEKGKIIEYVIQALPHTNQISDIDITMETSAIRFKWRGLVLRVSKDLYVEEISEGTLCRSNAAILFEELLKRVKYSHL